MAGTRAPWLLGMIALCATGGVCAAERLVFGSFDRRSNAEAFAMSLGAELKMEVSVATVQAPAQDGGELVRHRVVSATADDDSLAPLRERARLLGHDSWYWRTLSETEPSATVGTTAIERISQSVLATTAQRPATSSTATRQPDRALVPQRVERAHSKTEFDLGLQSRSYAERGQQQQSRLQLSASGQLEWFHQSADQRHNLTISPFFRIDGEDQERTHFDLREGYYSYIGDRLEVHAGVRQLFWGVTEFKHLVDIINQTDLVESIDGEDKLGQPLLQLSLSRDWGVLDLFLLPVNRERTFAGADGRLRFALPVDANAALYESGAGHHRLDGAIRWSHFVGPLSWGLHHFSGTNRDPRLLPRQRPGRGLDLVPYYSVIDQTGLDAQLITGDWSFKLEAITRSGDGDRYTAANVGLERTLVGVMQSRLDLGLVIEYLFDERGDNAHNTLFERDLAIGTRWALNDAASTQALLGIIWDTKTQEYVVSLEASRQVGAHWQLALEGRAFAGAPELAAAEQLQAFADGSAKSAFLQRDDFLQIELTRFF